MNHLPPSRILVAAAEFEASAQLRKILGPANSTDATAEMPRFEVVTARTPVEVIAQVHASLASGQPFTLAFIACHWQTPMDGLAVVKQLWSVDAALQLVLIAPATGCPAEEFRERLGSPANLAILKMPWDALETRQLVLSLAQKSTLSHQFKEELDQIQTRLDERTQELQNTQARDESNRQSLEAQLRLSQKMESVGQLAGGIAHDFNNLLTVIQGHASLALATETLTPKLTASLKEITQAAIRATDLTRQLLTFSRKQTLHPQPLDLNEVVKNFSKILRRTLGEDISLEVNASPELPPVMADLGMIEQVLLNLGVNSRDAMPKGGKLIIATTPVALGEADSRRNPEAAPGNYVQLNFSDTGCGIAPELIPRIFEPFFTTKELDRGTGLGLATVYGIIKQHQGWVEVYSEVDRGTTFNIFLPAGTVPGSASRGAISGEARIIGGTETILVVEDEGPLLQLIQHILQSYGYKVISCTNGKEALELWQEHRRKIELVLTDVVLPDGMTGPDLAEILKMGKPDVRVIFMSGYDTSKFAQTANLEPGVNFLQKPFHARTLAETVFDTLQKK